jgi:hypothetical protein
MYSLLLMYAESIGFLVEGCMMTLLGAIVNATSTIRYVLLVFWVVLYCAYCYGMVYRKYARLNRKLFQYIKNGMFDQLQRCVTMRHDQNKNTALKFLTMTEIRQKDRNATIYFDSEEDLPSVRPKEKNPQSTKTTYLDTINYRHGHLHWTIHGLILFVDRRDTPRIPRALFHQICELEAPGCPGPIHKTLGRAVKQLALIIIFLVLMFLLMMILEEIAPISTTSELIITLATGFLPLILLFVLRDPEDDILLNDYSFTGKVQQVIMAYRDTWAVYDLSFTREYHGFTGPPGTDDDTTPPSQASTLLMRRHLEGSDPVGDASAPDVVDPTHVDLLITIKDENELDCMTGNLRSEPCSLGSRGSLNSTLRTSPDDPNSGQGGATGGANATSGGVGGAMNTNKPTNATAPRTMDNNGEKGKRPGSGPPNQTASWRPGSPKINLVVDIAKGNHTKSELCPNGIPMRTVANSKYSLVNEKQPESAL